MNIVSVLDTVKRAVVGATTPDRHAWKRRDLVVAPRLSNISQLVTNRAGWVILKDGRRYRQVSKDGNRATRRASVPRRFVPNGAVIAGLVHEGGHCHATKGWRG